MTRSKTWLLGATLAVGGLSAMVFAQNTASTQSNQSVDALFLEAATGSNAFEIESSRLASDRAANAQIKQFAQMMITDHTKAQQSVDSLKSRVQGSGTGSSSGTGSTGSGSTGSNSGGSSSAGSGSAGSGTGNSGTSTGTGSGTTGSGTGTSGSGSGSGSTGSGNTGSGSTGSSGGTSGGSSSGGTTGGTTAPNNPSTGGTTGAGGNTGSSGGGATGTSGTGSAGSSSTGSSSTGSGSTASSAQSSSSTSGTSMLNMLPADKRLVIVSLTALRGASFDRAYATEQIAAHEAAIRLFRFASANAQNAQVKQFAAQTLPTLQSHYTMIVSIARALQ